MSRTPFSPFDMDSRQLQVTLQGRSPSASSAGSAAPGHPAAWFCLLGACCHPSTTTVVENNGNFNSNTHLTRMMNSGRHQSPLRTLLALRCCSPTAAHLGSDTCQLQERGWAVQLLGTACCKHRGARGDHSGSPPQKQCITQAEILAVRKSRKSSTSHPLPHSNRQSSIQGWEHAARASLHGSVPPPASQNCHLRHIKY